MGRRLGPTWGGLYRTSPGVLLVSQGHRTQVGYGDARKLARVPGHRAARHLIHASIGLLALPSDSVGRSLIIDQATAVVVSVRWS